MLVREKKYHENDLFQIRIMTLKNFGPLIFFTNSKSPHTGFSKSVKIIGAQMKKKTHIIAIWNSVKQNISEGENWR